MVSDIHQQQLNESSPLRSLAAGRDTGRMARLTRETGLLNTPRRLPDGHPQQVPQARPEGQHHG